MKIRRGDRLKDESIAKRNAFVSSERFEIVYKPLIL